MASLSPEQIALRLGTATRDALARHGAPQPELDLRPALPPSFADAVVDACQASPRTASAVQRNYLTAGPTDRVRLLSGASAELALLHAPLDPDRLPRTVAALTRLLDLTERAGVPPSVVIGAPSLEALFHDRPTWAQLFLRSYFGGFQAPLFGREDNLSALARHIEGGCPLHRALDPVLASALTHEHAHGLPDRDALQPPYLDEAIVLWITTEVCPGSTWPGPEGDHVVPGAPRLAEVGAALVREIGRDALLRAHFGVQPWSQVLAPGFRESLRALGKLRFAAAPAAHLLGEPHNPEPWLRRIAHAHAPDRPAPLPRVPLDRPADLDAFDRTWILGAVRGLCVVGTLVDGVYQPIGHAPGAITVDPTRGVLRRARHPGEIGFGPAESWLPWRAIPTLREREPFVLHLDSLDHVDSVAGELVR